MERAFLLDVVVRHSPSVFKALPSEDESLLIGRDAFLVLDLALDVLDAVGLFDLKGDGLAGEGPHKNLHTSSESEDEVESRLLLDVVVGHSSSVFKALSCKDESLLVTGNALLVLNLALDGVDAVGVLNFDSHRLSGESSHEDLHSSPESEDEVDGAFLLNVVVADAALVLELLSSENEPLLVDGDAFLGMDEFLEAGNAVSALHLARHGSSGECLHKDLHLFNDYGVPLRII